MKLVLFDIDGTLLNCGGLGIKALKRAMQKLYKKCPVFEESNLSGRTDLFNFTYVYKCLKGKNPTKAEIKKIPLKTKKFEKRYCNSLNSVIYYHLRNHGSVPFII